MKRELAKMSKEHNLAYDPKEKVMWGNYKGYKVAVKEMASNGTYYINIPLNQTEDYDNLELHQFIRLLLKEKNVIKKASYNDYSLKIEMAISQIWKKNSANLADILDRIISFARNYSYFTCCEICGVQSEPSVYIVNGNPMCQCDDCYNNRILRVESKKAKVENKKGNIFTGILGALLGSLLSTALWLAVYKLGSIAAVCGILLAVCVIKGYELFGGKLNKTGIIITLAITIAMVYVSTYFTYGSSVYDYLKTKGNISILDALLITRHLIKQNSEIRATLYQDLIKGYLFSAMGAISVFYSAHQQTLENK